MKTFTLRAWHAPDAPAIDALAVHAFTQFKDAYTEWPLFKAKIGNMSTLSAHGEIIVAEKTSQPHAQSPTELLGAVAYIGPHRSKSAFFDPAWPIMRMLVVAPDARGLGVGRALAEECIARGRRDGAAVFALRTSELMSVALPMYQRMGFKWHAAAPPIHGVIYGIYLKQL